MPRKSSPATHASVLRDTLRLEGALSEMVGMIRGVVADGSISGDEARRLRDWVDRHPTLADRWPANLLARRLERIFADGRMDALERSHLQSILERLVDRSPGGYGPGDAGSDLPLTRPPPGITFEARTFVFAPKMAYGPIHLCEQEVVRLGGKTEATVSRRTDYLVIGEIAAMDWDQRSFGHFVDQAVQYRARGADIAIVTESHWIDALP
ncbi:MAG: BRCT domain-containing protein [Gemmatimonadota bacterium]|nr:BRCT domain-containing protein [Gemmatimonadota bacterium]